MAFVLAFDQGTTSSRSIVFNSGGEIVSVAQAEFTQIYPKAGWVEHDPEELFKSQTETAIKALRLAHIHATDIWAVGITNQRETTIVWDRETGEPIYNAIVWQDRRTAAFCDDIRTEFAELIRKKTGLEVDAYFSASKLKWLLDNSPNARSRAERGELAFGTVDSWLIWRLTGGKTHATDISNASRTMLFNIRTLEWDDELLDIFGIPNMILPRVLGSDETFGHIESPSDLKGIEITGVMGDQQAALFGQACFTKGDTKSTYGTGCFMLQNTGRVPADSAHRLLTTVGWKLGGMVEYALEGSVFIGGAVVQWLRDELGIIKTSDDIESLAGSVDNSEGVFFVPAFVGLGTPYWDQEARGAIVGLTRGTGKAHIARAALESIAFQTADLLHAIKSDSRAPVQELRVDGGATKNDLLLQFQADILQIPVVRASCGETTAQGVAYMAGLSSGLWSSTKQISENWKADKIFEPEIPEQRCRELRDRWHEAVERSLRWEKR
jgi:glycerol kinase